MISILKNQLSFLVLILICLFLAFACWMICPAQVSSMSQIQRSQEILQKQEELTKKLEQQEKVFIKKIKVVGAAFLSEDRIKEIILPFQKKWLEKEDIRQILDLIKQAYIEKAKKEPAITYQIKKQELEVQVNE